MFYYLVLIIMSSTMYGSDQIVNATVVIPYQYFDNASCLRDGQVATSGGNANLTYKCIGVSEKAK